MIKEADPNTVLLSFHFFFVQMVLVNISQRG